MPAVAIRPLVERFVLPELLRSLSMSSFTSDRLSQKTENQSMRTFVASICGITIVFASNCALAEQESPYHACDNVRAIVDSLVSPELNDEQIDLLQGVLRSRGVASFVMLTEPDDRRSKRVDFNRQIQQSRDGGVTSSIRLRFGSTNLSIKDEDTCEPE